MKYKEEEAICNIRIFGDWPGVSMGPYDCYENIVVSRAFSIFKDMDLHDILKRIDLNPEKLTPGSYLSLFVYIHTAIGNTLPEETWPLILLKRWDF